MGYGDAIFAAGHAERIFKEDSSRGPIAITTPDGKVRWHPLWAGNPAISGAQDPPPDRRRLVFGRDALPYYPPINTPTGKRWPLGWRIRDHWPTLYLTEEEVAHGAAVRSALGTFVLLEPAGKDRLSPNRVWPVDRWQAVADALKAAGHPMAQLIREEAMPLQGVTHVSHASFRDACGILQAAALFVSTEGGLQVAAGALRVPAVILVSPCAPPVEVIGFPIHRHLVDDHPDTPCGNMLPCSHCVAAWDRLQPETVVGAILEAMA